VHVDEHEALSIGVSLPLGEQITSPFKYIATERVEPPQQCRRIAQIEDPDEATTEFLVRLKQYRSEVQGWLVHLPSESE
jgi:hypothetical protein